MENARIPTSEQLMAEMAWVRQLARALVKDAAIADDVAQDAWLVANEKQPDVDRPLRPWLARVVKNLIRTRRRGETRREQRDELYEDRTVATPEQLVERVELQRAVADEVLALAEPYRSTVLLHFVEGLSSADIARQLRIPDGTVRRRLKVALDQLREALEKRANPPKRGWLAALIPLAKLPGPASTAVATTTGVLLVKKVVAAVVLLLVLLGAAFLWHRQSTSSSESETTGSASPSLPRIAHESAALPLWFAKSSVPRRRIAGRVVASEGPVVGARVILGITVGGEPRGALVFEDSTPVLQTLTETTTGPDGAFDFGEQPGARFTISASASDHAASTAIADTSNPRADTEHITVRLAGCDARVSGTISDASGGHVAHARVQSHGSGVESDASGVYSICVGAQHAWGTPSARLRVSADGYGTVTYTVLVAAELRLDVQLVPEATLIGHVTLADGTPVDQAQVQAMADPTEMPHHLASGWALTDRDGAFRITAVAPGAFNIVATAHGRSTYQPVAAFAQSTTTSRDIHLVLESHARVRGVVVSNGKPVGGAVVTSIHDGDARSTLSEADGTFVAENLRPGKTRFEVGAYRLAAPVEVDVKEPLTDGVKLDVVPMARVHGHILRNGKPVAGADVVYMMPPQATSFGASPSTISDENGAYALEGLLPGPAHIFAMVPAQKVFTYGPKDFTIDATEDKTLDIELDLSGEIKGTVVDEAGTPLIAADVRFDMTTGEDDNCETITDSHGHFDCAMLMGGSYRPSVMPQPGARIALLGSNPNVTVPQNGVVDNVTLTVKNERLSIRGTVVDDGNAPLSDVHVEAISMGPPSMMDFPSTMTDANGRFEITNLAAGTYSLHAHAGYGGDTELPGIAAGTTSAAITLPRAGAIDGTLVGFGAGTVVFLGKLGTGLMIGGRAAVDGTTFSRAGLAVGRYVVEARTGTDVDARTIDVEPGKTAHVELHSRGAGSVEGTILDAADKPLAGMRCDAHALADGEMFPAPADAALQATSDARGQFTLQAPLGRTRIMCFPLSGPPIMIPPKDVDVSTAPAKVTLTAR